MPEPRWRCSPGKSLSCRRNSGKSPRPCVVSKIDRQQQKEEISDLGRRLNIELARRVNELERYRSEFFGQLREILGNNPIIQIEGDRFCFRPSCSFPSGSADLSDSGKRELDGLADVLNEIIPAIPDNLQWILRVDGHTDKCPDQFGTVFLQLGTVHRAGRVRGALSGKPRNS
jgi:flagellar motor protein MotB